MTPSTDSPTLTRAERLLGRAPLWLLRLLSLLQLVKEREWLAVGARLARTEWTEAPEQFPHCCTQGGCWAHTDVPMCACSQGLFGGACVWCRLARWLGKDHPADDGWRARRRALDQLSDEEYARRMRRPLDG